MANQLPTGYATAILANGTPNTAYTLNASKLLQGFSDPDGDTLKVYVVSASSGEVSELGNGQWRFTPDSNFTGTVNFDYLVSDDKGGEVPGSNSLTIAAVQSPPSGCPIPLHSQIKLKIHL